jgi:hypothetical protein
MKVDIGKYPKNPRKNRKEKVKIDPWDTWSMDHTLSIIIHPMLLQLKETNHGIADVDDEDVPEELRSTSAPPKENEYEVDANYEARWNWVMDEMIFAFEAIKNDTWEDKYHTGVIDFVHKEIEEGEYKGHFILEKGLNDTSHFDKEGWQKENDRISNGTRLFGKYFRALWD